MTAPGLIFIFILAFGVIGPPLVYFLGNIPFFYDYTGYMMRGRELDVCLHAYLSVLYSLLVLVVLHRVFLVRTAKLYVAKPLCVKNEEQYLQHWYCAMAAGAACAVVLFMQNGFVHPMLAAKGFTDVRTFAEMRAGAELAMNMSVYSVGLHIFTAYALFLALMVVKKPLITATTCIFFIFFATFSLAKSPIADLLLQLTLTYLLVKKSYWKPLLFLSLGLVALVTLAAYIIQPDSMLTVFRAVGARLFLGQVVDLPDYFRIFDGDRVALPAMLPPYIQSRFGLALLSPAKMVIDYQLIGTGNEDIGGVANSFFSGSAYAYAGDLGVLLAPVLVFLNFWLMAKVMTSFKKTPLNVFVLGYITFKLTKAIFSDMGYFVFSSIQIMLLAFLGFKLMQQTTSRPEVAGVKL